MNRSRFSEASVGGLLFENGYMLTPHIKSTGRTDSEAAILRRNVLSELRALARRMELVRIEVLAAAGRTATMEEAR